jgi:putative SOS response-associated peptidase YedK
VSEIKLVFSIDADNDRSGGGATEDYNIAPSQDLPVIHAEKGKRVLERMRWGLIPVWSKDAKIAYKTSNARAETVDTLPAFRGAWKAGRRCLVVTSGFYEWRRSDKQPYAIELTDSKMMVMAGIWEQWVNPEDGEIVRSFSVITTEANDTIARFHDRMPAILAPEDWPAWLGEVPARPEALKDLVRRPYPAEKTKTWPIGKAVGNVRNNGPELLRPAVEQAELLL